MATPDEEVPLMDTVKGVATYTESSGEDELSAEINKCVACSHSTAIEIKEAKRADHIKFKSTTKWCKIFYDHHAIVEEIDLENKEAHLIHYWNNGSDSDKATLQRNSLPFSEIWKVKKITYKNSNDEATRLENALHAFETSKDKYNLFINNCEHFSRDVCTDRKASKQVTTCFRRLGDFLLGFILIIPKLLLYFLGFLVLTADDIDPRIDIKTEAAILISLLFVYFVYVCVRNYSTCNLQCCNCTCIHKLCGLGNICFDCQKRDKRMRWIRFAIVLFFQLVEYALSVYINKTGKPVIYHICVGVSCSILTMIFIVLLKLGESCLKKI